MIADPRLGAWTGARGRWRPPWRDRLSASRREVPQLLWRDSVGSTNTELVRLAADPRLPAFTTLVTTDQTAGRGRLDRAWTAPAGTALAVSVLVRATTAADPRSVDAAGLGWLPLAAGAAMFDAVTSVLPAGVRVGIKWPNDVQLDGRKVCGILSELVPAGAAPSGVSVVIGAGLESDDVRRAIAGADGDLARPRGSGHRRSGRVDRRGPRGVPPHADRARDCSVAAGGDAVRSGLHAAVVERCTTLGREVRVELPGGAQLLGRAVGIDGVGRLQVRDADEQLSSVAAGDIVHLR